MNTLLKKSSLTALLVAALAAPFVYGQSAAADISDGRIATRMSEFVNQGTIAGSVTWISRGGKVVHAAATGYRDIATKTPMTLDTVFRVMSMTKPVTAVSIMLLVDEGRLTLSDPVAKYLPGFPDVAGWKPVSIRDLLTHTSGLSGNDPKELSAVGKYKLNLAEVNPYLLKMKLQTEPGTHYEYSGLGITLLGRIVEIVSGDSFEHFVTKRILEPLGMKDTSFFLRPDYMNRLAQVYRMKAGQLVLEQIDHPASEARLANPAGGLYSTAADMGRFLEMMRNHGVFEGRRILSKASADVMTRVHTGDLPIGTSTANGFGLGWSVVRTPFGALSLQSIGSYGHSGALGTYMWVDPEKDLIGIFMTQRAEGAGNAERSAFIALASASAN